MVLGRIHDDVLETPVTGVNLVPGSLRRQLAARGDTLLVFLRQLGCVFCRETIGDLREVTSRRADYPAVLFFFQGSPIEGRALLRSCWPDAHAVADGAKRFYTAFGLERGTLLQMFGPQIWRAKRRAEEKGYAQGERSGDIWMMPGAFLVRDEEVTWAHRYRHVADRPDFARLPEIAPSASGPAAAHVNPDIETTSRGR